MEHSEGRLYLVFEWVDRDLKKYMESIPGALHMNIVKVSSRPQPHRGEGGGREGVERARGTRAPTAWRHARS